MKKYLLFASDRYYPSGGVDDLIGDFDSVDDAKVAFLAWCKKECSEKYQYLDVWAHIVSYDDMKAILCIYIDNENPLNIKWYTS